MASRRNQPFCRVALKTPLVQRQCEQSALEAVEVPKFAVHQLFRGDTSPFCRVAITTPLVHRQATGAGRPEDSVEIPAHVTGRQDRRQGKFISLSMLSSSIRASGRHSALLIDYGDVVSHTTWLLPFPVTLHFPRRTSGTDSSAPSCSDNTQCFTPDGLHTIHVRTVLRLVTIQICHESIVFHDTSFQIITKLISHGFVVRDGFHGGSFAPDGLYNLS